MSILRDVSTNEQDKFVESSDSPGQVAIKVVNPDGSNIAGGSGGGDGAINDGVSSSIKASVLDYANSNPLAVRLTDTSGDYVGAGAGTQYTEDAAAAANPIGTALILVREDGRAGSLTTTDGDNVAARGNNNGELYVKHTDPIAVTNAGLTELASAIDTEVQVDVVGALPAGNNNIGDIDIASIAAGDNNIGNVDIVSSALPTGAATLAEQQSQTTHLATIAGDTTDIEAAVELIDDTIATLGTTTYTETTTKGAIIGAVRRDADTTLVDTTNEIAPLQVDANGRLKVEAFSGETLPVSLTSTTVTGTVAVTQSGTWDEVGINDSGNSITVDNGGTFAVQVDGSALTALQLIDDTVYTDDTSTHSTGSSKGNLIMAAAAPTDASVNANDIGAVAMTTDRKLHVSVQDSLPAGSNAIGKLAANSGVDIGDVDITSIAAGDNNIGNVDIASIAAGNNNIGDVDAIQSGTWTVQPGNTANTTPWLITDTPATSGGLSKFHLVGAATDNATNVKASAGQVYCITAFNVASTPRYLKFHNTAGTPTAGSGVTDTFLIPGNTSGAGVVINIDKGIAFGTGIGISIVTGIADNNTTAIGASEVVVNIYYK